MRRLCILRATKKLVTSAPSFGCLSTKSKFVQKSVNYGFDKTEMTVILSFDRSGSPGKVLAILRLYSFLAVIVISC